MLADPHCEFERSPLCTKLDNLVVVPVVKNGSCADWYLLDVSQIDLKQKMAHLKKKFADDYALICSEIRRKVSAGLNISTTNGQLSSDTEQRIARQIDLYFLDYLDGMFPDKNYAFYIQKNFMRDVIARVILNHLAQQFIQTSFGILLPITGRIRLLSRYHNTDGPVRRATPVTTTNE